MPEVQNTQEDLEMAPTLRPEEIEKSKRRAEKKKTPETQEEAEERLTVADIISTSGISARAGLEALEAVEVTFEEEEDPSHGMSEICQSYGLDPSEVAPEVLQKLSLMAGSVSRMRTEAARQDVTAAVERKLHEQLANLAFQKIDHLNSVLADEKPDPKAVEGALVGAMETMGNLARRLSPTDDADSQYWTRIVERFNSLIETKRKSGREVSRVFSRVMDQYSDFVEDEIISRKLKQHERRGQMVSIEDVIEETYGRTKEEMEEIKVKNRERAVDVMEELAEEPYVTTEMLVKLYKANNRGIAPKALQKLREGNAQMIGFGKRIGILPDDVAEEMKDFDERVASVIDRSIAEAWSDARFEVAVAELHNEFLEIHPFPDRNGSTGVLFMEMMMMRRGYKPPRKRQKNYYQNITKVLGYNPAAVAVVGYGMRRQATEYGYFAGRTTKGKEQLYDLVLRMGHKGRYTGKQEVVTPMET